jgi:hypothetical protein
MSPFFRAGETDRALSPSEVVEDLFREGYADDEVLDFFARAGEAVAVRPDGRLVWARGDAASLHQRRILDDWLNARRMDGPTDYAKDRIAAIRRAFPEMRRNARGKRVSRSAMATRVGIDRESITDWTRRGWMTWPPEAKNPQD